MDTPAGSRRGKTNCGFCGQALFGDVAYCPYCGRPSASAPAGAGAREWVPQGPDQPAPAPQATVPPQPGKRRKVPWKPIVIAVTALAFVIAVKELAVTTSDETGPRSAGPAPATAVVTAPVAANRGASASTAQAPRAEPVMPRVEMGAPPASHRSLCSPANEAAGLCNPQ